MAQSPASSAPRCPQPIPQAPLSILRTETVLSRFPIHLLTKRGRVPIHLQRTTAAGALELRWAVSYNEHYGPPRLLAYKLDTIVINQLLDALPRPLPRVLNVGSLRQICRRLDLAGSGRQQAELKWAFHQNASAYIVAYLRYSDRDGTERLLNTGFTRYSVVLTGERLPDGTRADAVYLVLSEPYREVLTHAPVRPLDYAYLKALTPMAQRFYELLSYKMFAALKHRQPHATLRYAEYCLLATQQRAGSLAQVQKQLYKVHLPHLQSGYLTRVRYDATTDEDGQPDWLLQYTPGPKARAEYAAFLRQPAAAGALAAAAEAEHQDLAATVARGTPPPPRTMAHTSAAAPTEPDQAQAHALVTAFYQRFHALAQVTPSPKELAHATQLLATHGAARAHFLLAFSHQAARDNQYQPQTFGGILHYLPRALAAYAAQATPATTAPAADDTRRWEERYIQWRQETLTQLRDALPPDALATLEAEHRARLVAEGTPAWALDLAVRVTVDAVLEARAGLPPCDVWRQQQEVGG